MLPLKIAFLWHQHQPYYKFENKLILPWVRLHGVKDYFDLPEILHEFPEIKQTFNFAPSLNKQINEYIDGSVTDRILELTKINADKLNQADKEEILEYFFSSNQENLINSRKRYRELQEMSNDKKYALDNFSAQDWRDLQVWFNLTWIGYYSGNTNSIKRLFKKNENFTEYEKEMLIDYHIEILKKIIPQMKSLVNLKQAEISVSPMYHPILPLLINSESAKESMPNAIMPDPVFKWKEDAIAQIKQGIENFSETFGFSPNGMWPSEGSVSDTTLELISDSGIEWIATDEEILFGSDKNIKPLEKFFPRKFNINEKKIKVLFRDHSLSDKIGFVYSKWNPWDAANDFIHNLHNIRNAIINEYGDEALEYAVVPVILDGENCWEFYKDNGIPFLRELYTRLTDDELLKTVTCSEATNDKYSDFLPALKHIRAGSWINANFNIWIGDKEDRKAWELLGKAREHFEKYKNSISNKKYNEAIEHIYTAEGSDWFWWYGPEHHTENKDIFDKIFRWHLKEIYRITNSDIPEELEKPISAESITEIIEKPKAKITPELDGKYHNQWNNAGIFNAQASMSAMHQANSILDKLFYGNDNKFLYLKLTFNTEITENTSITVNIHKPYKMEIKIKPNNFHIQCNEKIYINEFKIINDETIDLRIPIKSFGDNFNIYENTIEINFETNIKNNIVNYPGSGNINLIF